MKTDLKEYIKIYNIIDAEICRQSIEQLNQCEYKQNLFYNHKTGVVSSPSGDNELLMYEGKIPNTPVLMQAIWNSLQNYVTDLNFEWFSSWVGYSTVSYNRYHTNTKMALHCDHIHSIFTGEARGIPILSVVGSLNDGYTGGEFIMFDDYKIKLNPGELMVFPSNFMYPHKVNLVTSGVRDTFVSWAW